MDYSIKQKLESYLIKNGGKLPHESWVDIYNLFPAKGEISRKAKSDFIRGIWKRLKRSDLSNVPNVDDIKEMYTLPIPEKEDGLYIVVGCAHFPFTNKDFWKALLKLTRERSNEIKGFILAGDAVDLHSLSAYDRGKLAIPGINLGVEYKGANAYIDSIEQYLQPNIYKGFIYGNHCHRFHKYMSDVNNAKLGSALPSPIEALKLKERGYDIYTDWVNDEIQLGDLSVIHGEICSIHAAKRYIDVFKRNFLFFHTHRTSMFREGEHVAYNAGSMADFNSPVFNYATKAMKKTWTNSFAVVNLYKGITQVDIPVWNNDHFSYGGKIYK